MGFRSVLVLVCTLMCASPAPAQPEPSEGVDQVLARLRVVLDAGDEAGLRSLVDPAVDTARLDQLASDFFVPGLLRSLVRDRDRAPLDGILPGDGYRVVTEVFTETASRAQILTLLIDMQRPAGGDLDSWRITDVQAMTSVRGLYRLRMGTSMPMAARNLTIAAEDLLLTLPQGTVYAVECDEGVTGLILLGRGVMTFAPAPDAEKGQMRIFAGEETLTAEFDTAFVRLNPADYEEQVATASLLPSTVDPKQLKRAEEIFARESPRSFSLDLADLSSDTWYLLPQRGDFLAEVRTRRHGTLTYAKSSNQAEDIRLFNRDTQRTISVYASAQKLAVRGPTYNEDEFRDYDVIDYNIEASISPERQYIEGRAQLRLRVRTSALPALSIRLADTLAVTGVGSLEFGRHLHFRVRDQNTVIINLPGAMVRDTELTIVLAYAGTVASQGLDAEAIRVSAQRPDEDGGVTQEPKYILSNRSYWYPQNMTTDYATATVRIVVPKLYSVIASGVPKVSQDVTLRDLLTIPDGRPFVFSVTDPVRYLAVVVSRFVRAAETTIEVATGESRRDASGQRETIRLAIDAHPSQQGAGRELMGDFEDIMRFYAQLIGDAPYASTTLALVEDELPGGHSPGYFALLNNPLPFSRVTWRNDPAAFADFPEFFIAHELAHQWWGQAVGWRNYHEQWLSEGFSQYFAALYARQARGDQVFVEMLRQFRRWAIAESDQGPVYLGYRLGHIKNDMRIYRALVYNKGAAVLHMLRRFVGDEVFFNGIRRFYTEQRFQKAGTEDLRLAFEAESGRSLARFFDRWIYSSDMPRIRYSSSVEGRNVTMRFQQAGELVFDVPVTVSIGYADGRTQEVVVPVTEREMTQTITADGVVKQIQVNRDFAALAEFDSR